MMYLAGASGRVLVSVISQVQKLLLNILKLVYHQFWDVKIMWNVNWLNREQQVSILMFSSYTKCSTNWIYGQESAQFNRHIKITK